MAHFYESLPERVRALSDRDAIESYLEDAQRLPDSIAGLSDEQLNEFPVPNTWSIRQIVVHLMDTDLIASYRMKRIIAEDRPRLDVYDENAFVGRLFYQDQDAARAAELFCLNRAMTADVLRRVADDAFMRPALHPEIGEITLGQFLRLYVHHLRHHLKFIRDKRGMILQGV